MYISLFSFETSGDYVQHITFNDAENYLTTNNTARREYPLVVIVHSFIDDNPQDYLQLVKQNH